MTGILPIVPGVFGLLSPMLVLKFAAYISFVHFNLTHQRRKLGIFEHRTHAMTDVGGGLVGGRPAVLNQHPLNLQCRNTFLGLADEIDNLEPDRQRIIGVLEYRPDQSGEAITVFLVAKQEFARGLIQGFLAALAYPSPVAARDAEHFRVAAANATNAIWPAYLDQQFHALVLSFVLFVNLSKANHEQTLHLEQLWCQVRNKRNSTEQNTGRLSGESAISR
jgi:hypothetical protein